MKLSELAAGLSSKNAGNFHLTFDIVFDDAKSYRRVLDSGALTPDAIAACYGVEPDDVVSIIPFEPGNAIKINMRLDFAKMEWLLKALAATDCPMSCPHGRPIAMHYSTREILKAFHRI